LITRHVIVTEGLGERGFRPRPLRNRFLREVAHFSSLWSATHRSPWKASPAFQHKKFAKRPGSYATGGNGAIYYGLGVTEHSQGSTMVMGIANLAMADRQHWAVKVWASTRCAVRTTFRARATWALSRTNSPGYRHVSDDTVRHQFESKLGRGLAERARSAHSEHV